MHLPYSSKTNNLVNDWNNLLKSLIKYELIKHYCSNEITGLDEQWITHLNKNKSIQSVLDDFSIFSYYDKITQLNFVHKLLVLLVSTETEVKYINQFKFLKKTLLSSSEKVEKIVLDTKTKTFKPTFYFSTTLKELFMLLKKEKN